MLILGKIGKFTIFRKLWVNLLIFGEVVIRQMTFCRPAFMLSDTSVTWYGKCRQCRVTFTSHCTEIPL
jgi:hypothetical protein